MKSDNIGFPVYRKYKNNKSYFKISSLNEFEELQVVGSRVFHRLIRVQQYPEKLFLNDLIYRYEAMGEEISASEYEEVLKKSTAH